VKFYENSLTLYAMKKSKKSDTYDKQFLCKLLIAFLGNIRWWNKAYLQLRSNIYFVRFYSNLLCNEEKNENMKVIVLLEQVVCVCVLLQIETDSLWHDDTVLSRRERENDKMFEQRTIVTFLFSSFEVLNYSLSLLCCRLMVMQDII
jgi:hypothetical protein